MVEWKDGTKVSDAYVDENNKIIPAVYSGNTPLTAHNLNKAQQFIDTYTGDYITANTIDGAGKIKKIFGNLSQKTRNGKNLIELVDGDYTNSGITATVAYGIITLNGTASANGFIELNLKETVTALANVYYTLSANNVNTIGDSTNYCALRLNNDGNKQALLNNKNATYLQCNTSDVSITKITIRTSTGITYNNFVIKPQFELGQTATEWEQGGIAPSLDYSADIYRLTHFKYRTTTKNLFDYKTYFESCGTNNCTKSLIDNGIRIKFNAGDNAYIGTNVYEGASLSSNYMSGCVPVRPNTTYKFQISSAPAVIISYLNSAYVGSKGFDILPSTTTSTTYTITTNSKTRYLYFRFGIQNNNYTSWNFTNIQLEQGSQATTYVPYKGESKSITLTSEFLAKTKNYSDTMDEDGTINKVIKKVEFNGGENWSLKETSTNTYRFVLDGVIEALNVEDIECNRFKTYIGNNGIGDIDSEGIALRNNLSGFTVRVLKSRVNDLAGFKQLLADLNTNGTPVEVFYASALPYTSNYEAFESLIPQYDGETVLDCNTEVEAEFTKNDGIASAFKSLKIIRDFLHGGE